MEELSELLASSVFDAVVCTVGATVSTFSLSDSSLLSLSLLLPLSLSASRQFFNRIDGLFVTVIETHQVYCFAIYRGEQIIVALVDLLCESFCAFLVALSFQKPNAATRGRTWLPGPVSGFLRSVDCRAVSN